jgi:hypothetical protein
MLNMKLLNSPVLLLSYSQKKCTFMQPTVAKRRRCSSSSFEKTPQPLLKLIYFPLAASGRGLPLRFALELEGLQYVYETVTFDHFLLHK